MMTDRQDARGTTGGGVTPDALLNGLEGKIEDLPEAKFVQVVELLDRIGHLPDARQVIDRVRPRLKRVRPPRRPSLQRVFCLPFEDLLIGRRSGETEADGRIQRVAMGAAWTHVRAHAAIDADALEARIAAMDPLDVEGHEAIGRKLWPAAALALTDALSGKVEADPGLFGHGPRDDWREEIAQIVRTLDMGVAIEGLKRTLPSAPIRALGEDDVHAIRRAVIANARGDAARSYAILSVMLARVTPPGVLLERLSGLDLGLSQSDRGEVLRWLGAPLVGELGRQARQLETLADAAPTARAAGLRQLVGALDAAARALKGPVSDLATQRRVAEVRTRAVAHFDAIVDGARGAISAALADGEASHAAQAETESNLVALRACAGFAGTLKRDRAVADALGDAAASARASFDEAMEALKADPDGPGAADARARMFRAVRLIELSVSPQEAEVLWRQALAAGT